LFYDKPDTYSPGLKHVIASGVLAVENEKHPGARARKSLYGPGVICK
jgi:hypothetical protein